MVKISVVCPTIRKDGLKIVYESLQKQTFQDWEWLVGSKFDPEIEEATWVQDTHEGGYWTLNRCYNDLIRRARGELIVSWQDWIWVPPDGLEKFWDAYVDNQGIITGVGDQYEKLNKWGKPEIKIWSDPRKTDKYGSFYECFPQDVEWNWAAIPKEALLKAGGFDEKLDFLGYGGDQLQVGVRLDALKYRSYIDQTNESFTLRHGREDFGGQQQWDEQHVVFNGKYAARLDELKRSPDWPCLHYLD
jgi:hypothetical protein